MTPETVKPFTPISPNPFIVGNPVRGRTMFFGREAEFDLVRRRCHGSDRGGLLVFCGERRSGKTSILFQIMDGRLGAEFIPVLIDMQSMAISNEVDFLTKIADEILEALGPLARDVRPPRFGAEVNNASQFQRFVEEVLRALPKNKLILLFDEYELFENKIESKVLSPDVLHILSSLKDRLSVFLIFTGSQHIEERRRDYWRLLGASQYKQISYLEHDDAIELIRRPVENVVQYGDDTVERIYRLTAGQPFYTQAVCQSLVDRLNEMKTNAASMELLDTVITNLVNNPLPQMIFLWDSLEHDERLVLALLAENLDGPEAHATAADLARAIRKREYPLDLGRARISTALEKLFKNELLLKSGGGHTPGFAFRMDLWRLWINRMHSVWQVMRELGLDIRPAKRPWALILAAAVTIVVLGAVGFAAFRGRDKHGSFAGLPPPPAAAAPTNLAISVLPAEAEIFRGDKKVGDGAVRERIPELTDVVYRLTAPGYADSSVSVHLQQGAADLRKVLMRPLLASLRIESQPPGAEIRVDGDVVGKSPVVAQGLQVPKEHRIEAQLDGYGIATASARLKAEQANVVRLTLVAGHASLTVATDPPGAHIAVDGAQAGNSPATVARLAPGRHAVTIRLEGFNPIDTTLELAAGSREVRTALVPAPPGILVVQGDVLGSIWVDGNKIFDGVQSTRDLKRAPGSHRIQVSTAKDEIDTLLVLHSRERVIFDYSSRTVRRIPGGAP